MPNESERTQSPATPIPGLLPTNKSSNKSPDPADPGMHKPDSILSCSNLQPATQSSPTTTPSPNIQRSSRSCSNSSEASFTTNIDNAKGQYTITESNDAIAPATTNGKKPTPQSSGPSTTQPDDAKLQSTPPSISIPSSPKPKSKLSLLSSFSFFNVQGLIPQTTVSKRDYIKEHLKENNSLFIGLSETWLLDQLEAEVNIENYDLYRADSKRTKNKRGRFGGGVALYLREDIAATTKQILDFSNNVFETLSVHSSKENLCIATVYRQPDDSTHGRSSNNREFKEAINKLKE